MEKKKNNEKNKEEGVVYRVSCKNCNKIYIGETKFKMKKRIEEHKKYVEYERISNSAIARHVGEFNHENDWEKTIRLEREKILFPRKILESVSIKENKERCMSLNEGIEVNMIYGRGKNVWIKKN
jgi:GIY-YIG catalytic domain.